MFGNKIQSGGRTNVVKMIVSNSDYFRGKSILVLIDYVAFGSNFESFVSICNSLDVDCHIFSLYRSFEYFLLRSNIIKDSGLDLYVNNNFLKFNSLENLYTKRLKDLTKNTMLSYKKNGDEFSVCYYKDCYSNNQYRSGNCRFRLLFDKVNKFEHLVSNTEFDIFLSISLNN